MQYKPKSKEHRCPNEGPRAKFGPSKGFRSQGGANGVAPNPPKYELPSLGAPRWVRALAI